MKLVNKIKEILGVGDSVRMNITRAEYEVYAREQKKILLESLKEEEGKTRERQEALEATAFEAIRQKALHAGPSMLRRAWWRISDLLSFVPDILSKLEQFIPLILLGLSPIFWLIFVVASIYCTYQTGLIFNFCFVLIPLIFASSRFFDLLADAYLKDGKNSLSRELGLLGGLEVLIIYLLYSSLTAFALAPLGGYVGIVKSQNGTFSVEDYSNIWWIKNPLERASRTEYYQQRGLLIRSVVNCKIAGKDFAINVGGELYAPDVSKFLALHEAKLTVGHEVQVLQGRLNGLLTDVVLSAVESEVAPKLKVLEDAKKVTNVVAHRYIDEAERAVVGETVFKVLLPKVYSLGAIVFVLKPDSFWVSLPISF